MEAEDGPRGWPAGALGTPPDERVAEQPNAGFVNLFGTPDFNLAAPDMMTDALNIHEGILKLKKRMLTRGAA